MQPTYEWLTGGVRQGQASAESRWPSGGDCKDYDGHNQPGKRHEQERGSKDLS